VEQQPGWPEYLDALETYLGRVTDLLGRKSLASVPTLVVTQPRGPIPAEQSDRVASLLAESERVETLMSSWMEDVLSSMRSIEARRRLEPCRTNSFVDSML
jgi:hypothetical protein